MNLRKRMHKVLSFALAVALALPVGLTGQSIESNAAGSVYLGDVIGVDRQDLINELKSHENDNFYLNTPYEPFDWRSPNGDPSFNGRPGMNCTGFVWYALHAAGANSKLPALQGWIDLKYKENLLVYNFSTKAELLASGLAEKGDVIWMFENGNEQMLSNYHHVGFFWGDTPSEDKFWHSSDLNNNGITWNAVTTINPKRNGSSYQLWKLGTPAPQAGSIDLLKVSGNTDITDGYPAYSFEGAVFTLSNDVNSYTLTTDVNGRAHLDDIASGTYTLTEVSAPRGYNIGAPVSITISSGQTVSYTYSDQPITGTVDLLKISSAPCISKGNSSYGLDGAEFILKSKSTGKEYTLTTTLDVNGDATASVGNLPLDVYTLVEIKYPTGHTASPAPIDIVIDGTGRVKTTVPNQPLYDPTGLILSKVDRETGDVSQGDSSLFNAVFHFDFYDAQLTKKQVKSGEYEPVLSFDAVTKSSNGRAKLNLNKDIGAIDASSFYSKNGYSLASFYDVDGDFMFPMGTLAISETSPSEGYTLNNISIYPINDKSQAVNDNLWIDNITKDGGSPVLGVLNHIDELSMSQGDVIRGDIQVQKWDKEINKSEAIGGNNHKAGAAQGADLNGIVFTITNHSKNSVFVGGKVYDKGQTVTTIKTHWNDKLNAYTAETTGSMLPYGTYGVKETRTNGSYLLTDGGERMVEIREDGVVVTVDKSNKDLIYKNQIIRGDVEFNKIVDGSSVRVNTLFAITNVTTGEKHVIVSDKNGEFYSSAKDGNLHTSNTNANDIFLDSNKIISMKDVDKDAGVWFGLAEDGSIAAANDTIGAFPYGEYRLDEIRTDTNKGLNLQHFTFYIYRNNKSVNLGTITDVPVRIGTTAVDDKTGTHTALAESKVTLTDTVKYEGLTVGTEYKLSGTLMDRESKSPVLDKDGKPVTGEATFTPTMPAGTQDVKFEFDASELKGHTVVVFEQLLDVKANDILATHEDIDDDGQSVHFPEIGTTLADKETGEHEVLASEKVVLSDTVSYKNLIPGKEYTMSGVLMDKDTNEPLLDKDGKKIVSETTFKPEKADGIVVVDFEFAGSSVAGKTIVAFESCESNGANVAVHADINDDAQTVHFPGVKTTATDKATATKQVELSKTATIVDVVAYNNLTVDKEYVLTGKLMDKASGKALLDKDGKEITSTTKFTTEESTGTVELSFTLDSTLLQGRTIVAFETVSFEDKAVAVHADINDEDQTVYVMSICTTATASNLRDKNIPVGGKQTIIDTVEFTNLIIGQEYTMEGVLMNRATGRPVVDENGNDVVAKATFKPEAPNGSVQLPFEVDTSTLAGATLVVFEKIYSDKHVLVGQHEDIDDEGQSVVVDNPELITTAIQTGIKSLSGPVAIATMAMLIASIGLFVVARRTKKRSNLIK